ncbi:histidine--tRNA ligase [Winogradskyella pulchriflava]|uniref:Histidine--tRNA ligase n=1 Tax=Winogradskyella pulchriflava TaxID=1110688 RepID=A0ABV6QAI1_9FLAO
MAQKPSIPKGTRDFNAEEVAKRSYIMETIKEQFQRYGFQPIETPSFENSETLMGKYGDEGDRLIFKILNSGEYIEKFNSNLVYIIKPLIQYFNLGVNRKKEDEGFNLKAYFKELYKDFSKEVKNRNSNFFIEEKLPEEKFIIDLLEIIDYQYDKIEDFGFVVEENIEYAVSIVFSDFYFALKSNYLTAYISEKALRYDLTVPFARYVVQHQNEIEFPFKRYQIQPVWRADRPQKGRFREFYQCDADVVGSKSLFQEVEFVQLYDAVFTALKLEGVTIKINNRKILSGIAEVIGAQDKLIDFTVALDKLDKIGEEKVKEEMLNKGISEEGISKLQPLFSMTGSFGSQIGQLKSILSSSEEGKKGVQELEFIEESIFKLGLKTAKLQLDVTLARGLNYYTGAIFEVSAPDGVKMGSIGGGGRYDDLTSIFGKPDTSGVGISFGLDRIYLVLEELSLFPDTITEATKVLFISFGDAEAMASLQAVSKLRENGVKAEIYPDAVTSGKQMKKQMTYANRRNIPYVVLVGEEELNAKTFALKHMETGEQQTVEFKGLLKQLQS